MPLMFSFPLWSHVGGVGACTILLSLVLVPRYAIYYYRYTVYNFEIESQLFRHIGLVKF